MADPKYEGKRLETWQQIADHLRVSVRTAQKFEGQSLPVRRRDKEGQVFAFSGELDVWDRKRQSTIALTKSKQAEARLTSLSQDPDEVSQPPHLPSPQAEKSFPLTRHWRPAGAVVLVAIACGLLWGLLPAGPMADFRVQGTYLIALNEKGRELWRYSVSALLFDDAYLALFRSRYSWLGDLDGDGTDEFLFVTRLVRSAEVGTPLLCFAEGGKVKWQFIPGRPVRDVSGDHMLPPYLTNGIQVIKGRSPSDTRIIVSSNHHLSQPNQVAVLNIEGKLVGEYWHPGHLLEMNQKDLDKDGKNELLLAGVNNGDHRATLVVLDPWSITGQTTPREMDDERFRLLEMAPAKEKALVLFPRTCISRGQPYTRAWRLQLPENRILVTVAEGPREGGPGFVYELDHDLRVSKVVPTGIEVREAHQMLEAQDKVDHPFSEAEWQDLQKAVTVRK